LRARSELLAFLLAGCSFTSFDPGSCTEHAQCRQAFGFGAVCGTSGLCEQAQLTRRCDTVYPPDLFSRPDAYRRAIVLGSLADRSSPAHVIRERAVRLAMTEVGEALEGQPLGMVFCDIAGEDRTAAAVSSAGYLVKTLGAPAIIGPSASSDTQQVWEAVRGDGAVVISPAATSPALTDLEPVASDQRPGLLWRTAPPDSLQGRAIAEDMLARGVRHAMVMREGGAYGEGLAAVFTGELTRGGGQVELVAVASETQIGSAVELAARSAAGEVLFISSQQEWVSRFVNVAFAQSGMEGKTFFLTDAAANQAVLDGALAAAPLFPRIRGTRPAPRDPGDYVYASFLANYRAEYMGEDPSTATFSAHAYDAAWLALYGTAWSLLREQAVTGPGISRGIRHLGSGAATPLIPASWPGVLAAFRSRRSVDVSGASGELDFDPITKETTGPIEIWSVSSTNGHPAIVRAPAPPPPAEAMASGKTP
jgi:ABC-type branched-subunit amino acid transport system substrate-binding protein